MTLEDTGLVAEVEQHSLWHPADEIVEPAKGSESAGLVVGVTEFAGRVRKKRKGEAEGLLPVLGLFIVIWKDRNNGATPPLDGLCPLCDRLNL